MERFAKSVWRWYHRSKLKRSGVYLRNTTLFNRNTVLGGYNSVGTNSVISNTIIGKHSYIGQNCKLDDCIIGNFCSIGANIKIITNTHPTRSYVSTSPEFFSTKKQTGHSYVDIDSFNENLLVSGKKLIIGNDVWIGDDVTFIGGISVGDGAIIALGAVVTKDVPPYAIVGGVPAKIIRYRFTDKIIEKLKEISWWDKSEEWLQIHAGLFADVNEFVNLQNDSPQK